MKGPWCLVVSHAGGVEVSKLFRHRPGKFLQKSSVKFFESCVTLGPKYEPLQLLLCEGVDHAGHLVLLAHVGALISYQELACPLLKPLFGCHEFGLFQLSQLKFENHGWCRSCGWGGYSGGGAAAAVFFIFPRGQSSRAPLVALLERSLLHGRGGISSCRTKSLQLFLLSV